MDWTIYIWLGLMVLFLLMEAVCAIHLVSIWFAVGALAALLACMMGAKLWLQITLFLMVSAALLAMLWPLVRKFLRPNLKATNLDSVIGSVGLVTVTVDNLSATGQVKLGAMEWTARSTTGTVIEPNTQVKVDRIEGVKVFVTPVNETVNV